ncbi:hypothetical protein OROMI_023513 [Orobanche minor]
MELLEQKDLEVSEKIPPLRVILIRLYVNLTENAVSKDARLADLESELGRLQATLARVSQEKELLERHNTWLNEELTAKVDSLIQMRKTNGELEAEMCSKLVEAEYKLKESSSSLTLHKDRVRELEEKLASMETELVSTKDAAAAAEGRFSAEISTMTKLVDLYKESYAEWSKKAGELEGVIRALETHLNQVESEYKDKLEKEVSARNEAEKATSARVSQEKELLERHNTWLNEELTAKVDSLIQMRKTNGELEAEMCSKLVEAEYKLKESSSSLILHKDRVRELEEKLAFMETELVSTKDAAAAAEGCFSAEISTMTKLVDLYKESSEEWSKKAGELEGVIRALETHLNQVESEYKDKLEKEVSARNEAEKESADLKEKLHCRRRIGKLEEGKRAKTSTAE